MLALTYHDVIHLGHTNSGFMGLGAERFKLARARFAEHLDAVAASGIEVSLSTDAVPQLPGHLFLTFDDGGTSASTTIAPMLADRGWKGHFFVVTSQIGAPGFLGADAVRDLRAAGHVVGSHSHTHPDLSRLPERSVAEEWRRSKSILEDMLGEPVTVASVPTGFYSRAVGRAAVEAGLSQVFSSDPWLRPRRLGYDGSLYGRFSVISTTPAERIAGLCGLSRSVVLREAALWYARKTAKRALGPIYARLREPILARLPRS